MSTTTTTSPLSANWRQLSRDSWAVYTAGVWRVGCKTEAQARAVARALDGLTWDESVPLLQLLDPCELGYKLSDGSIADDGR